MWEWNIRASEKIQREGQKYIPITHENNKDTQHKQHNKRASDQNQSALLLWRGINAGRYTNLNLMVMFSILQRWIFSVTIVAVATYVLGLRIMIWWEFLILES